MFISLRYANKHFFKKICREVLFFIFIYYFHDKKSRFTQVYEIKTINSFGPKT